MRKVLPRPVVVLLTAILLTAGPGPARAAHAAHTARAPGGAQPAKADDGILAELKAIPGMTKVTEQTSSTPGVRWFAMEYRQPVDHRHPEKGWFEQRLMLQHKSADRPVVLFTTGYADLPFMIQTEPTRLVDGNQLSLDHRYFATSIPDPPRWRYDTIWQAAADEHRIVQAFKSIYHGRWISTGGSKGGMTATYHKRFFPGDVDGTVAYVAPNDANNKDDSAYDRFLDTVGTAKCRTDLRNAQRELLRRRPEIEARMSAAAGGGGYTWKIVGSLDRGFENEVVDLDWSFWQFSSVADCAGIPPVTASTDDLYAFFDQIESALSLTDQRLQEYVPYYYQSGTQLGWPATDFAYLRPLLRYKATDDIPRTFVPRNIPMRFHPGAMRDVDHWVRTSASHMLFVYGANDPWSAEKFRVGPHAHDAAVMVAPGQNHVFAAIATLSPADRAEATADVLRWAGVPAAEQATPAGPAYRETRRPPL